MSQSLYCSVAVIGIDIGKNSFHVVGLDPRGASCCARSGRAARSKHGLPICRGADRHGGLCRCASSQSEAQGIWSRRPTDAGEVCAALLQGAEE